MGWASRTRHSGEARDDRTITEPAQSSGSAAVRAASSSKQAMSAALVELIEPYRDEVSSLDGYRTLVTIGAVAWNLALFPEDERQNHFDQAAREIGPGDEMSEMVLALSRRKEQRFPDERRMIVSHEVSETATGYHLVAVSAGFEEA